MKSHYLYEKAVKLWGIEFQLDMIIEECLELSHAIFKYKRGKVSVVKLAEEGVDVYIMLRQLQVIIQKLDYRIPSLWSIKYEEKIKRLEKMLENSLKK